MAYRQTSISTSLAPGDTILGVSRATGPVEITIDPAAIADGIVRVVNDEAGATNQITLTPTSGTISGRSFRMIERPYSGIRFYSNGKNLFCI